jgi:arabinan endo-1,5-alpha-L-arabinosidase
MQPLAKLTGESQKRTGDIRFVHDPTLISCGDYYYVYCTGKGIPIRRSKDKIQWEEIGRVFESDVPAWGLERIPGSSSIWAPEVVFDKGLYKLYYSISTFGKNRSALGLATNKTLDTRSPEYHWTDHGEVFASAPPDPYNAIDPAFIRDEKGKPHLSFGSFWSGIYLIALDEKTNKAVPDTKPTQLAFRPELPHAVEAPYIFRRKGYFYLFVSFDLCCRGVRSTYNVRVGRSKTLAGPYIDAAGLGLLQGGGTQLTFVEPEKNIFGPGHCMVFTDKKPVSKGSQDYLVHHFYDGTENGVPTLQIRPITWDKNGWPCL